MKEGKQYSKVSAPRRAREAEGPVIDRTGWADNRPQFLAQARLIGGIQKSRERMIFPADDRTGIQKKSDSLMQESDSAMQESDSPIQKSDSLLPSSDPMIRRGHSLPLRNHSMTWRNISLSPHGPSVIQAYLYLRGLQQGSATRDKEWLERTELAPTDSMLFKRHFQGLLASLTRYNEGQKFYYSPVGYIVEITDPEKIFANFSTDGNTGDLQESHFTCMFGFISESIENLRAFIDANSSQLQDEHSETYLEQVKTLKKMQLALLMKEYQVADNNAKAAKIKDMLKLYYSIPGVVKNPLGPGLEPPGLIEAEAATRQSTLEDVKYTETKAALVPADLRGAYYNDNEGTRAGWEKVDGSHKENAKQIRDTYHLADLYKIDAEGKRVLDPDV